MSSGRLPGTLLATCSLLLVACGSYSTKSGGSERICDTSEVPCEWDGQCNPALCKDSYPSAPACSTTVTLGALEWTQCDNGADINAFCAACFAKNLALGGHQDWRLPSIGELSTLYQSSDALINICNTDGILSIDPRIEISCFVAWSSTVENNNPDNVDYANFGAGANSYVNHAVAILTYLTRALAVRNP
jgi:hypothetical protein